MSEKMNVLFIITDQQRADHLGCAGNPDLKTPNLDKLASEGIRFTNTYVANPMCMPNRATIFTGKYPSVHGVRSNGINLNPNIPTITQTLLNNGYHTCSIGKIHLNYYGSSYSRKFKSVESMITSVFVDKEKKPPIPKPYYGLDEVEFTIGHGWAVGGHYLDWLEERNLEYYKSVKYNAPKLFDYIMYDTTIPEELYQTTYVTEKTISFLKRFSEGKYGNKPFFLHCSFPDPHHPVSPPGKYKEMYDPEEIKISPTFRNLDRVHDHEVLGVYFKRRSSRRIREEQLRKVQASTHESVSRGIPEEQLRKFQAYTYGTVSMIDHGIGQILAALNTFGLEENTMVIFTSDHGDFMGDHGIIMKGRAHYQGEVKVPFIWKVPGLTKPGTITNSLASSIDIPTTILNLLNIKHRDHPPGMQGYDLTPIFENPEIRVRDNCIIEEDEDTLRDTTGFPPFRARTMITDSYRITVYQGREETGDLYDLKNDPYELNNLWHDKNSREIRDKLLNKLLHEIINVDDRTVRQARA
ncbi:MAG: sulfatase [Candidatus Hodarchaeota archaeon]